MVIFATIIMLSWQGVPIKEPNALYSNFQNPAIEVAKGPDIRRRRQTTHRLQQLVNRIYVTEFYRNPSAAAFGDFCSLEDMSQIYLKARTMRDAVNISTYLDSKSKICSPAEVERDEKKTVIRLRKGVLPEIIIKNLELFRTDDSFFTKLKIKDIQETGYKSEKYLDLFAAIEWGREGAKLELKGLLDRMEYLQTKTDPDGTSEITYLLNPRT